ncbi:MAG: PA0069 family radical SAM protein [Longimicrobiales bacterium]
MRSLPIHGRGTSSNPANRFTELRVERDDWGHPDDPGPETRLYRDSSRSVITTNDSPDVGFDASVNPYRGCEHGCGYCYARPNHEYLGLSAGLDFETKIFVKEDAPELLRKELASPSWKPKVLVMSGVTDPYQPAERRMEVTRGCLEVLAEARNPVSIITKSHLVTRDIDHLAELAAHGAARVTLSVTTLRNEIHRAMEPRASVPKRRLGAIRELAEAGVPVGVNVAPVVPGLTDHEMADILEAAAEAGATRAGYIVLRLPFGVKDLFVDWLEHHFPDRKDKVVHRLESLRGGKLNDPRFGSRMKGEGPYAAQIRDLFEVTTRRMGFNREDESLSTAAFRRPPVDGEQMALFR